MTHHGGSNGKAEDISKQFEQKGIALLSLMKYKDALEAFNTSLSYSPLDALRGSLHTHRAKAFMHCKLYESALKNVDLAKDYGIDFATHETKRICENQTTYTNYALSTELHNEIMGLSYVKNPKVPAVVHCIKLESDWKYGRHIIATQALVTGDIIAIEEPFWQSMISKKHHNKDAEVQCCYKRCYHCFKNSAMNLVACDTCEIGKEHLNFLL